MRLKKQFKKILPYSFFEKPTVEVAKKLLGKFLVRRYRGKTTVLMITDVEAYDGFKDKASHAHRGKTARNEVMFGKAGVWYVYFTYGMHWMLNVVTGKKEYPAAVLIRGIEGVNGPARLTKFLHIDKKLNGKSASKKSGLWVEDRLKPGGLARKRGVRIGVKPSSAKATAGLFLTKLKIKKSPRIGVDYAGPVWSKKHYRFYLE